MEVPRHRATLSFVHEPVCCVKALFHNGIFHDMILQSTSAWTVALESCLESNGLVGEGMPLF